MQTTNGKYDCQISSAFERLWKFWTSICENSSSVPDLELDILVGIEKIFGILIYLMSLSIQSCDTWIPQLSTTKSPCVSQALQRGIGENMIKATNFKEYLMNRSHGIYKIKYF